jgi:hypothetical protein
MYDYFLGGSHNFAVDRQAAEQVVKAIPNVRQIAVANGAFLRNAVLHLVDLGVRQFLDVGFGIPTVGSVHEVAQTVDPQSRVVYVDIDPVAVIHAQRLLSDNVRAAAINVDLRHPEAILAHRSLRETLDLTQPVGLLLVSVLHFLPDSDAYPAVAHLRRALPSGGDHAATPIACCLNSRSTTGAALCPATAPTRHAAAPGPATGSPTRPSNGLDTSLHRVIADPTWHLLLCGPSTDWARQFLNQLAADHPAPSPCTT